MKLARLLDSSGAFTALIQGENAFRLSDLDPALDVPYAAIYQRLDRLRTAAAQLKADASVPPIPLAGCHYLSPLADTAKLICLGHNYRKHIAEMGSPMPQYPVLFSKLGSSLIGHGVPIEIPPVSPQIDYEAELVIVIGQTARRVEESAAWSHVFGFTVFNDVSLRDYQKRTVQWFQGKNFDRTSPLGPAIVSLDEIDHPNDLAISTQLNDEVMQDSRTGDFIFSIPAIVAYISQIMTLNPGDMIATGTPSGVGAGRKPPVFMRPGDTVKITLEQVGSLENRVVAEGSAS